MHKLVVLSILLPGLGLGSVPVASDLTLYQIATNTLNSVRELNEIATEQREFSENFERVYSKIDQAVWKADRTAMWLEDMKSISEIDIGNMDDFNYVLRSLKDETSFLRNRLILLERESKETEKKKRLSKKEEKRSKKRILKYSSEAKSNLSPNEAQVETAKNTKDLVIENARLNAKIDKLSVEISKLTSTVQKGEQRRLKKELEERKKLSQSERGILSNRELNK